MDEIYTLLAKNLNNTFYNFPESVLRRSTKLFTKSIENTIYDCNVKYRNRFRVNNINDLVKIIQLDPTIEAVFLYRIERELFLDDEKNELLPYLASMMHRRTGCEIYYSTEIGKGFNIQHGFGIVIGPRYTIGENFTIHQGVTLGQKQLNNPNEQILIGDNVTICANSIVLGNIVIGDNSILGAGSLLISDMEKNTIYVGSPARRIKLRCYQK